MSYPKQAHGQPRASRDASKRKPGKTPPSIDARVRGQIAMMLPSEPTITAVAKALDMTVRMLQRRLSATDTSYRRILDDLRRRKAETELISSARSVAEIARRLGYSDPSHFVRAFRRWTGHAPSHFAKTSRDRQLRIR